MMEMILRSYPIHRFLNCAFLGNSEAMPGGAEKLNGILNGRDSRSLPLLLEKFCYLVFYTLHYFKKY